MLIENFEAVLLDLAHVNESYEKLGLTPIDGVLGGDVLYKYNAAINYKNGIKIIRETQIEFSIQKSFSNPGIILQEFNRPKVCICFLLLNDKSSHLIFLGRYR